MEYDTNKIQVTQDDVGSIRKSYGDVSNELTKAESVLDIDSHIKVKH